MANAAALTCTTLTTPLSAAAHPWWLYLEGMDASNYLVPDGFLLEDLGGAPARLQVTLRETSPGNDNFSQLMRGPYSEGRILLYNAVLDRVLFEGWIKDIRPLLTVHSSDYVLDCLDLSDVMDWTPLGQTFVVPQNARLDSIVMVLVGLCGGYITPFTSTMADPILHQSITLGPKTTVRQALDQVVVAANSSSNPGHAYYTDRRGQLILTNNGSPVQSSAYNIDNDNPDDVTKLAAVLVPDYDSNAAWDSVYGAGVSGGAQPGGDGFFGPSTNIALASRTRISADPLRTKVLDAPSPNLDRSDLYAINRGQQSDIARITATLEGYWAAGQWERGWGITVADKRLKSSPLSTVIGGLTLTLTSKTAQAGMSGVIPRFTLNLNAAAQRLSLGVGNIASQIYKP